MTAVEQVSVLKDGRQKATKKGNRSEREREIEIERERGSNRERERKQVK